MDVSGRAESGTEAESNAGAIAESSQPPWTAVMQILQEQKSAKFARY
jgi:hypothetical protein